MNRIHMIIGRFAVILGGLTGALLAFWSGSGPAAMAASLGGAPHGRPGLTYGQPSRPSPPPGPPGWNKHPPLPAHAHTLVTGGMPGWQITLIAVGAALLAAALAVTAYRMRAARRRVTVSAA
jgi:hypothetical protein